jgi:hypothetical protein
MIQTTLKSVQVADAIRSRPEWADAVERASKKLEEVLGQYLDRVEVRWDLDMDSRGHEFARLTLRDATGEVSGELALDELHDRWQMGYRLYALWGDLLQIRSHKELAELRETLRRLDED